MCVSFAFAYSTSNYSQQHDMAEESSLDEGEFSDSSSSLEQADAPPPRNLGPSATSCIMQEERISYLVQFLKARPCRHIIVGIIKGILEDLSKYNIDRSEAFFKKSELIGTTIITIFGGDTSHWTEFCAVLANNMHELANLRQPVTCTHCLHEKVVKWESKLERLKKLEQKESYIRNRVMKQRVNRDSLIIELYKKTKITIHKNGGLVQEIQQHEAALDGMVKELKVVASKRKQISEQCDQLKQSVLHLDPYRVQRETKVHAIYKHVCATLNSLLEKLED